MPVNYKREVDTTTGRGYSKLDSVMVVSLNEHDRSSKTSKTQWVGKEIDCLGEFGLYGFEYLLKRP